MLNCPNLTTHDIDKACGFANLFFFLERKEQNHTQLTHNIPYGLFQFQPQHSTETAPIKITND